MQKTWINRWKIWFQSECTLQISCISNTELVNLILWIQSTSQPLTEQTSSAEEKEDTSYTASFRIKFFSKRTLWNFYSLLQRKNKHLQPLLRFNIKAASSISTTAPSATCSSHFRITWLAPFYSESNFKRGALFRTTMALVQLFFSLRNPKGYGLPFE